MPIVLALLGVLLMGPVHAACKAESGPHTAALVELYTSEGCSSCPPADRWLSGLGERGYVPGRVVPLALHVDYWDYIGWKDPHARREFSQRQRKLSQLQRLALVYTPQVLLQGRDFRAWGSGAFDAALARINAQPAQARIGLQIRSFEEKYVEVVASAELVDAALARDAALYLAVYESRIVSRVTAGETAAARWDTITWCSNGRGHSTSARSRASRSAACYPSCPLACRPTPAWSDSSKTAAPRRCSKLSCFPPARASSGIVRAQ